MNIGAYGILVIFAIFIILIVKNPRLSCFGKKLKSPLYPLFRRKKMEEDRKRRQQDLLRKIRTDDYGFQLEDSSGLKNPEISPQASPQAEDRGHKLD
jgi:hypothetical protein